MDFSELIGARHGAWKPGNQNLDQSLAGYRADAPRIDPAQEGTMRLRCWRLVIGAWRASSRVVDSDNKLPQVIPTPQCRFDDQGGWSSAQDGLEPRLRQCKQSTVSDSIAAMPFRWSSANRNVVMECIVEFAVEAADVAVSNWNREGDAPLWRRGTFAMVGACPIAACPPPLQ